VGRHGRRPIDPWSNPAMTSRVYSDAVPLICQKRYIFQYIFRYISYPRGRLSLARARA
jgi:hypothetical protein